MKRLLVIAMTAFISSLAGHSCPLFAAEDLSVGAQVDKTEVGTGEKFTFALTIAGPLRESPKIELSTFEGFQVVSTGQSQQLQMRAGQMRQTLTLTYTLAPTTPGTHTLGPVKVEYEGKVYETQPIEVKVVQGEQQEETPPRSPQLRGGTIL